MNLTITSINHKALECLSFSFVQKMRCFAFEIDSNCIKIAIDSHNPPDKEVLHFHIQKQYPTLCVQIYSINDFDFFYQKALANAKFSFLAQNLNENLKLLHKGDIPTQEQNHDVVALLDFILLYSIQSQSSDIHFESNTKGGVIRYRIDGILHKSFEISHNIFEALSTRIKLECNLDISEKRKALDGRFSRVFMGKDFDFRFSSMPSIDGESLVLRILQKEAQSHTLQSLGFTQKALWLIKKEITKSSGVILLVGPTGCGKSTTLYAILESIKDTSKKIITIEDPIEYRVDGLTQVLLNEQYDFSFEKALRGCLRQDPDVLMIGEIRDSQTLDLAFQASLTGHLVFATLHANDTLGALDRILGLGGKVEILANNLSMIIAQRLARKLCEHCKYSVSQDFYTDFKNGLYQEFLANLQIHTSLYRSDGCVYCDNSGFYGRLLLSEILPKPHTFLNTQKPDAHFIPMSVHITQILEQGLCSVEEVYRVWG